MQARYWGRIVGGSLGLFVALPLLVIYRFYGTYALGVYIGTGIAVLWYTVETFYLRNETVRHNAIAIQPVLVTDIGYSKLPGGQLTAIETVILRNIGQGPALYVQIEDIVVDQNTGLFAGFNTANVVRAGEEVEAPVEICIRNTNGTVTKHGNFIASLKRSSPDDYDVVIHCRDLGGQLRTSVIRMGKSGVRLMSHS